MRPCNKDKGEVCIKEKKVYPLLRKEREKIYKFINKQLRKRYIRSLKSPQTALLFFIGKKNNKKYIVQNYKYLNK